MQTYQHQIIIGILIVFLGILFFMDPIPQDISYHNFADQRTIWGIPNFWDVMSNLPICFLGAYGLLLVFRTYKQMPELVTILIPLTLCLGIFTACFGSAYYHWSPDNPRLFWDRLPMTLMFMPIFSLLIYDFISPQWGKWAFYTLVPFCLLYTSPSPRDA